MNFKRALRERIQTNGNLFRWEITGEKNFNADEEGRRGVEGGREGGREGRMQEVGGEITLTFDDRAYGTDSNFELQGQTHLPKRTNQIDLYFIIIIIVIVIIILFFFFYNRLLILSVNANNLRFPYRTFNYEFPRYFYVSTKLI